jgi:hypothetical protein
LVDQLELKPGTGINTVHPLTAHTSHPALEDGTNTGFRNVGLPKFDAGEIPKRIHTIFNTRRKFEIKYHCSKVCIIIGMLSRILLLIVFFAQTAQSKSIVAVFSISISETANWIVLKFDIEREL